MHKILHITAHMGGGVGKTLSDMCIYNKNSEEYKHSILCLEPSEKRQFINLCLENDVSVTVTDDIDIIAEKIKQSDIVQISWWHHPKMAKLLAEFPNVPVRLIIWSHVSGCNYPCLPYSFLEKVHRVFFTSKYSYENPFFTEPQREYINNNSDIIYGCSDLSDIFVRCKAKDKKSFNVGYIGTLDYSKLYPEFVRLCSRIDIPNIKFIMVGDIPNGNGILSDVEKYGMNDKFEFKGYTTDVFSELAGFDLLGYPLNSYHFGTTENVILEAMVSKVPVVAFNQCAEKYLIKHMETGLLSDSEDEYVRNIEYFYNNRDEITRMGENSEKYVLDEFDIDKKMKKVEIAYGKVLNMPSKVIEFKSVFGMEPYEWFLSCLGKDYELFKNSIDAYKNSNFSEMQKCETMINDCGYILKGKSKSSVHHFAKYYPEDKYINYISEYV